VTDREGNANLPEIATAVSKGGTAAYLSSNQNAFHNAHGWLANAIKSHLDPQANLVPSQRSKSLIATASTQKSHPV
jgi:hypothetical protein